MSQSIRPKTRSIAGLSVRYAESEPRDEHALLFSPWAESIYGYEPTWNRLAEHTHLVAIAGHRRRYYRPIAVSSDLCWYTRIP